MTPSAYDEVPYESLPIPYSAPEQLSLVSQFYGGPASKIDGCTYLEIGCGSAGNLLPLAYYRPADHFVGFDASEAAIATATQAASTLGIDNLELFEADLADVADADVLEGRVFDFVLAHGVLSWIAPALRQALLSLVARTLAPGGVACVSYNTMPGFGPRGMLRETLLRLTDGAATPSRRVQEARRVSAFLVEQLAPSRHPYAAMMVREARRVVDATDGYVAHELLAEHNHAFWYGELDALARTHGLSHVGDNWLYQPAQAPPEEVWSAVCDFSADEPRRTELIDTVRYRQHRSSLLRLASEPVEEGSRGVDLITRSRLACDGHVEVNATTRGAIDRLRRAWPRSLPFAELADDGDQDALARELEPLFISGELELRLRDPDFVHASTRRANPLVRHLCASARVMCAPTHHAWTPTPEQRAEIADVIIDPGLHAMLAMWGMLQAEET